MRDWREHPRTLVVLVVLLVLFTNFLNTSICRLFPSFEELP